VTHYIISIITHDVGEEGSFSVEEDYIGWRLSKSPCEKIRENIIVRQLTYTSLELVTCNDAVLDMINTENELEMKREAEERILH
jgi:hypothetical protein